MLVKKTTKQDIKPKMLLCSFLQYLARYPLVILTRENIYRVSTSYNKVIGCITKKHFELAISKSKLQS